jgi:redox-sensitive bicupin YhaK (pirin superfamily)
MATRSVDKVVTGTHTLEGAGFEVTRPFPTRTLDHVDPFLLLDEMGPTELKPGQAQGAPDHPHRGFETVTYVLEGEMEHKDSQGNAGSLGPGDVQWMTAGAGVVHAEMPSAAFQSTGGRMHGFQLWVNLPRRDKMMKPRYQELKAAQIPVAEKDGVRVKVIAGEALGVKAGIDTRTPIFYLHFTLAPGARHTQPVDPRYNALVWVVGGQATVHGRDVAKGQAALLARDGDEVVLENKTSVPADLLLLGGLPIEEPVARYGPFVMNEEREILEAIDDYRRGKLGRIDF